MKCIKAFHHDQNDKFYLVDNYKIYNIDNHEIVYSFDHEAKYREVPLRSSLRGNVSLL
jgi:hypothetical protein